jgi:hypothetical protein
MAARFDLNECRRSVASVSLKIFADERHEFGLRRRNVQTDQ